MPWVRRSAHVRSWTCLQPRGCSTDIPCDMAVSLPSAVSRTDVSRPLQLLSAAQLPDLKPQLHRAALHTMLYGGLEMHRTECTPIKTYALLLLRNRPACLYLPLLAGVVTVSRTL